MFRDGFFQVARGELGKLRAKQVERILSGDEPRDNVGAFLASLVQDLRDVSKAEVPSSVAARHLLKMRLATETFQGGPEPVLEAEETVLPPPSPLERRRPRTAALGLAAALMLGVVMASAIARPPDATTRAGRGGGTQVPPRQFVTGESPLDRMASDGAPTTVVQGCGMVTPSVLALSRAQEMGSFLTQAPETCPPSGRPAQRRSGDTTGRTGAAADQALTSAVTGTASAGAINAGSPPQGARGDKATDGGGSGGERTGSSPDTGSADNPTGGGTDGTTEPGKSETRGGGSGGNGGGDGGGRGGGKSGGGSGGSQDRGDGPQASAKKSKGKGDKGDR